MRTTIRSYHTFLPGNYIWLKVLIYLLYPIIGIFGGMILCSLLPIDKEAALAVNMVLTGCGIIVFEFLLDYFAFGGIASKDTGRLEYLKTSVKGEEILKKGLIADVVRRFLSIAVILSGEFVVTNIAFGSSEEDHYGTGQILLAILLMFVLSEIGLCITRMFELIGVDILVMQVIYAAYIFLYSMVVGRMQGAFIPLIVVLAVLSGLVLWLHFRLVFRRVRKSYQD